MNVASARSTHSPRRPLPPDPAAKRARDVRRQAAQAVGVLVALTAIGTAGYVLVEGWSVWDAFFMTATTITTVGYGEVHPLTRRGELFTIVLLVGGVGAALYTLNAIMRLAMEGELSGAFSERQMRTRIERLREHSILCGFGRVGAEIARTLAERGEAFVVIDLHEESLARAQSQGYDFVHGDATHDDVLRRAGVEHARCVITALDSDADNSWVVLSARALNQKLWIVVRAEQPHSEAKLHQAGADRVVSPTNIGGRHMALAAVQPLVTDFTQTFVRAGGVDLMLAQLKVEAGSPLDGTTVQAAMQERGEVVVLGVQKQNGSLVVKPDSNLQLAPGDQVIVLGQPADLEQIGGQVHASG